MPLNTGSGCDNANAARGAVVSAAPEGSEDRAHVQLQFLNPNRLVNRPFSISVWISYLGHAIPFRAPKNKDTRGRRPPKSAPDAPRSGGTAQNNGGKEGGGRGGGGGRGICCFTATFYKEEQPCNRRS